VIDGTPDAETTVEITPPPGVGRREYQIEAVRRSFAVWDEGVRNALVIMPTGTGKTVVAGMAIAHEKARTGRRSLFVAHRRELISQAVQTFQAFGLMTAVDMADQREKEFVATIGVPDVTVATVQSLKGDRMTEKGRDAYGLMVIDEAHRSLSSEHRGVIEWFDCNKLGITATPDMGKRNLGSIYQRVAFHYRFTQAIKEGFLAPVRTRRLATKVDLRLIRTTRGDFSASDLAARIAGAIESLAFNVASNIGSRQTVVFTPDVGSARAVASMLTQMGVSARAVAGESGKNGMPVKERVANIAAFAKNEFQVITCCDLLTEGYDCKQISCVVVAKPTLAAWKYVQMVGRGTRPCPEQGKTDLLVLDLDWTTDASSREMCSIYTLIGEEEFDPGQGKRNRKKTTKEDMDLLEILRELESGKRSSRLVVRYTGLYAEKWATIETDAIGVGAVVGLKYKKRNDFDINRVPPASEAQIAALRRLGVKPGATLTKWGASKLLTALERRRRNGQASYQQVKRLLSDGVDEEQAREFTRSEASRVIAEHIEQQVQVKAKQMEMFNG
jgi:superfamily II DNA or RNA helicase